MMREFIPKILEDSCHWQHLYSSLKNILMLGPSLDAKNYDNHQEFYLQFTKARLACEQLAKWLEPAR